MKLLNFYIIIFLVLLQSSVQAKSALIIVDMQNCFINGDDPIIHSLPVEGGEEIVEGINSIQDKFDLVVATKDWHTADHISFASQHEGKNVYEKVLLDGGIEQTLWPEHCVQNTPGADFVKGLDVSKIDKTILKGNDSHIDSYSGFFDNARLGKTELDGYLKMNNVTEIYVVGLAADFCVKFTSLDGADLNYKTYFIKDLTKAVFPDQIEQSTYKVLKSRGVKIISSEEI